MTAPRNDGHALSSFWNALTRGNPAEAASLDASTAEFVLRLDTLSQSPLPGSARERARQRVFEQPSISKENTMTALTLPASMPATNGHSPGRPVALSRPPESSPVSRRHFWLSLAAVLLLLLAGLGGVVAYDRFGGNGGHHAVIPAVQEATPESGWPQFRGGAERTGYTADPGPGGDLNLRWTFTADDVLANPVSDGNTIYVSGRAGNLYALDATTGAQRWGVDLSPGEYSGENRYPIPAVDDGVLYTGTFEGNIVALDTDDGSMIWQRAVSTEPVVASFATIDDQLYLITPEGTIQAIDKTTGATVWEWTGKQPLSNWAAAVGGGLLYVPDSVGSLVAIDVTTGETSWVAELGDARRNPAYADGVVYIGGDNGSYYALDATTGSVIWTSEPFSGDQTLNPIVTPDALIATWMNGPMRALDLQTGAVLWENENAGPGEGVSPHASARAVYVVSRDSQDYVAYDLQTGAELGRVAVAGGSVAAISGENLILGSFAEDPGLVSAFGPGSEAPIEVTAGPTTPLAVATPVPQVTVVPTASTAFDTSQVGFIWSLDELDGQALQAPAPVVGPDGTVYISTLTGTYLVSPDGTLIDQWPETGSLGFDADGNVYVFDNSSMSIKKFGPDNTLLTEWGSAGTGNGQFGEFYGTVDPVKGLVYAVEFENNRVQVFDLDGNFLDKWGSLGRKNGEFTQPASIAIGPDGLIYVGDAPGGNGGRVQIFDAAGTFQGTLLDADGNAAFSESWGLAFDSAGNIYVSDYWKHSIRVFDPQGREIGQIADVDGAGAFTYPSMLAIDAGDNLYVGDFFGDGDLGRIVKLSLPASK